MSRLMYTEPEVENFGAARLTREILQAERRMWMAATDTERRRWCWYRERCLDWRYCAVRGVTLSRVVVCPRCLHLFSPRRTPAFHAKCWCCDRPWLFT